ncbi:hypothetical protein GALMADRAFT_208915 [Galerina marginata CBS 339.88]|uniref:Uncharacterized protein n=1 Tax=Galerina marginata (strain CBS 339.88) TaxID=685588 RepID=A0A067TB77_GALM3|nr:hypothetical protein GALMADRAFT_208915 [Galerina marginata CBS 339.88]
MPTDRTTDPEENLSQGLELSRRRQTRSRKVEANAHKKGTTFVRGRIRQTRSKSEPSSRSIPHGSLVLVLLPEQTEKPPPVPIPISQSQAIDNSCCQPQSGAVIEVKAVAEMQANLSPEKELAPATTVQEPLRHTMLLLGQEKGALSCTIGNESGKWNCKPLTAEKEEKKRGPVQLAHALISQTIAQRVRGGWAAGIAKAAAFCGGR